MSLASAEPPLAGAWVDASASPVLRAMLDPATYPRRTRAVELVETHGSWVFLTDDRVYKVKKPVVLSFLDYGTLSRRRALCREEVRLNRRLAPDLYLGTVALVERDGRHTLVADDERARDALEVAVEMRRFSEDETLAARIRAGTATERDVEIVGHRLARFHATAATGDPAAATAALRAAIRTTLDDLADAPGTVIEPRRVHVMRREFEAALFARAGQLAGRGARGLVRDGHGDLRAEHVLSGAVPQIFDCLEFDPGLRIADVTVDLAFLVMDLEALGAPRLARALVYGYRAAGGNAGDDDLVAMMAAFRALVRAKVALVRATQPDADTDGAHGEARRLVALAERLMWRVRGRLVVVCCGPAASGKSTLAAALAERSGWMRVSSDVVRKRLAHVQANRRAPAEAYAPAITQTTYRSLGLRAKIELANHDGVIVDATFHRRESRDAFADALGTVSADVLFIESRAPAAELERRATQRAATPGAESDATADIVRHQLADWEPLDDVAGDDHTVVRTDRPAGDVVDDVLAWLDRRLERDER